MRWLPERSCNYYNILIIFGVVSAEYFFRYYTAESCAISAVIPVLRRYMLLLGLLLGYGCS